MYTRQDIGAAIGNSLQMTKGMALNALGTVRDIKVVEHTGYLSCFGNVRDRGGVYLAGFSYSPSENLISRMTCGCKKNAAGGCAHVAALLLAAQEEIRRREETQTKKHMTDPAAQREAMQRRREQIRLEQERREQEAAKRLHDQVDAFIRAPGGVRAPSGDKIAPVMLMPLLERNKGGLALELRIGRKRLYVVRGLMEFANRCEKRERVEYGKELTFSHQEEEVRESDVALLWHIVSMAQGMQSESSRLLLSRTRLDQTMRLLVGREIDWRGEDGKVSRVRVKSGVLPLDLNIYKEETGYRLTVDTANVIVGSSGAYFLNIEAGEILCAFSQAYERIAPLLRLANAFPKGAPLAEDQLGAVCTNLIRPAAQETRVVSGGDIVRDHTPMPLTTKYYIDTEEGSALTCRIEFDYGGELLAPGADRPEIRRDTMQEEAATQAAKQLFPVERTADVWAFEGEDDAAFELIDRRLSDLEPYGEVLIAETLTQQSIKKKQPMAIGISVSESGMLIVKADLGGMTQDDLMAAYTAYRLRKKFVRLPSGAFLSGEALDQAAEAAKTLESVDVTVEQAEQGAEVPLSRMMYLNEALKERKSVKFTAAKSVQDWIDRLARAQKTRAQNPETLKATLRDYQLEGLSWLTALCDAGFGGILADDMGLGKTMQTLALLLSCKERGEQVRALVVCPASLQLNWENEAEKFAPSLSCCALMGDAKARKAQREAGAELMITSYDQLRRDVQSYAGMTFTHVFLDEAQNIKNAASQSAKAVKTLKADHRFALTGTPIENRLSELWSIFDFLMPGYLLSYKKFRDRFEAPIVREEDEETMENLRMMTAPFILRRMKADVLDDLPEKTEKLMTSEMTEEQKRIYHAFAAQIIDQADGGFADPTDRFRILAGLTRLRQICCDPRLCLEGYAGGSGKLAQCLGLVRDMIDGGHRVLLFSSFTAMLDILRGELEAQGISTFSITGDTDKRERMELVERFNDGDAQVFLISLKAGGTGLNLTGADVVIHYDPWWNTSAQNQATDRAYRIGQKRGVQVFKLIAGDTIEARILKLQQHKSDLSDGILGGDENLFTIDAQMLKGLLK